MDLELEVTGLADMRKQLQSLESKVSTNIIRSAVRFAVKPMIDAAKAKVPVDSDAETKDAYVLRDNIKLRAEAKRFRITPAQFRLGPVRQTRLETDPEGYAISGGLSRSARAPNYAAIVEKKQPYLMPAFQQTNDLVLRRFADKIRQRLSKL